MDEGYIYVSEETYQQLLTKLRLHFGEILLPLRAYGQGVYVDGAVTECVELAERFGEAVRGKEVFIATQRQLRKRE